MTNSEVKTTELDKRRELPNRPSLSLQEATTFAFYGYWFSSKNVSLSQLKEIDSKFDHFQTGSIYSSIDVFDSSQMVQVHREFNTKLSAAAFAGDVRFSQLKHRECGQAPAKVDITPEAFDRPREFSIMDDTIGECGGRTQVRSETPPRWDNVFVERDGYINFLRQHYPTTIVSMVDDISGLGPPSKMEEKRKRPSPAQDKIRKAEAAVFPEGIPSNLRPGERNHKLCGYMEREGIRPPCARTFSNYYKKER